MKPFHEWVMQPIAPVSQLPELPEGLWQDKGGNMLASCFICECPYPYNGDPADGFDQSMSYCGKSERCCP